MSRATLQEVVPHVPQGNREPGHAWQVRAFRRFLLGSFVSRTGDWMDMTVLNWVVLQMTGSSVYLGLINACRLLPTFIASIPAGMLADRYERKKLLLGTHMVSTVFTFLLAAALMLHSPFGLFALLVTLRSFVQAMDPVIRGALIPNLVPESCMSSALSMHVAVLNLSRMIGPAVAGGLLSFLAADSIFILTGLCILGGTLSLSKMPQLPAIMSDKAKQASSLREALHFIKQQPLIQALLTLAVIPMLFAFPYTSLMPYFAQQLLQLGPGGFGMLLSVSAIGALLGSVGLSVKAPQGHTGKWLVTSIIAFGLSWVAFIESVNLTMALISMLAVGLTGQTYRTMSRITLQKQVPDDLRGRVLSIALMDRGFIPLGTILIGAAAEFAGPHTAGLIMGGSCIAVTLAVLLYKKELWRM
ncbi:MFS transporter [Paenibacillus xerothermodurans]|uniref:MFS transporter n=1 Tax=Paenibacillus xerothermodurans TaxID=1977292 RepID=A0A2W1N9M4_PAEXE|nr:MFS transporter [Paenibacillus xerothermodurans]PZE19861.1 MFS transporter [Paenibacillus xerothermodurans]